MMVLKVIKLVYEVFKDVGINFDEFQFVLIVVGYYIDVKSGYLFFQFFNSFMLVLYYNKDVFKKVGLDLEQLLKIWQELVDYIVKLRVVGMKCGYVSGW